MVGAGVYDIALVVGFEKMERGLIKISGERSYGTLMGFSVMPAGYALLERRYMEDYGATEEMFAQVSVKSHKNGALNPNAQYQKPISLEQVLNSRVIADPIHLFECSPTTDGASAVVIARRSVAEKFKPGGELVKIAGWAQGSGAYQPKGSQEEEGEEGGALETVAQQAYERAGIGPEDIEVTQVHDAFSPGEVFSIEGLGLGRRGRRCASRLGRAHGDHRGYTGEHRRRPVVARTPGRRHRGRHGHRDRSAAYRSRGRAPGCG